MHCNYDITLFPFDLQNCTMQVGSWMHTRDQMDIFFSTPTDIFSYKQNSQWDLISMMAHKLKEFFGAAAVPWSIIDYNIVIQRRPSYYILTFVLPSFIITTISIIGVFAPFNDAGDREEKVTMGLTTLLTMTVMVTLIADKMPKSSDGMPLLGIYIMLQIGIAALSSLMAVIVMYQHCKWTYGESVPQWILTITRLTQKKGSPSAEGPKYLTPFDRQCNRNGFIKDIKDVNSSDNPKEREEQTAIVQDIQLMMRQIIEHLKGVKEEEILRKEWQRAAQRLDLLLMLVFLVLNCILTVGFLAIGYSNLITKT
uniref:Uncharacterized protein n=1 Tax=Plectus sambesii TaxID=2011161 RepID=A0A914V932_9BILA